MNRFYRFLCVTFLMARPGASAMRSDDPWTKAGADGGLRQAFEQTIYRLDASSHGSYLGSNPAQRLDLEFNSCEARLNANHLKVDVGFRLTGYGYGAQLRSPSRAKLAGAGARLEYQRDGITEWYVNEARGLEQGFTLTQRPGTASADEPLVIAVGVSGGLRPSLAPEGDAVLLQSGKQTRFRYSGLHARDARAAKSRPGWRSGNKRSGWSSRTAEQSTRW